MCKAMQEMRNETAVKATISAYHDVDIVDEEVILQKLLKKFSFLSEETALKYIKEMDAIPA